jgi:Xaa-Pro dipeptidase
VPLLGSRLLGHPSAMSATFLSSASSRADDAFENATTCAPCDDTAKQPKSTHPAFFFSRGKGTYVVESPLPVPARAKLVAALAAKGVTSGVVLLRGGISTTRNDTDHEELFRQESYFAHLFGVREPDCWGLVELASGRATLLIPRLGPEYAVWMGTIHPPAHFRARYHLDACGFVDQLSETVGAALAASPGAVHVLGGINSDSGLDIAATLPIDAALLPPAATLERSVLYDVAAECRVIKSPEEIDLMRYARWVSLDLT